MEMQAMGLSFWYI